MSRVFVILSFSLLLFSGCQSTTSPGSVDPFLGRTRIPPPSTGSIYTPPADPYYSPQQNPIPQSGVPGTAFPLGGSHQTAGQTTPPASADGWTPTPSFAGASLVSESATPDLKPSAALPTASTARVQREPIIRVLEPAPRDVVAEVAPARRVTPSRVVNIVDLPRAAAGETSGFRQVSAGPNDANTPVVGAVAEQPVEQFAAPVSHYGADPSYAWLRGKLEYSQVDHRWKLRYIPVQGNTDQYGGSVVIANEAALAGCERGEFVTVRGQITGSGEQGFAPLYEVTALERLGR